MTAVLEQRGKEKKRRRSRSSTLSSRQSLVTWVWPLWPWHYLGAQWPRTALATVLLPAYRCGAPIDTDVGPWSRPLVPFCFTLCRLAIYHGIFYRCPATHCSNKGTLSFVTLQCSDGDRCSRSVTKNQNFGSG